MKKNNKFRNNNGNSNAYSLNYKFDSISPAGKCSGTALDLIKRYNELAKEAHGCGDYIEMEVFRQYAEHYRKIVTEINERKNQYAEAANAAQAPVAEPVANVPENSQKSTAPEPAASEENAEKSAALVKKTFKIIEVKPADESSQEQSQKPKRRRKVEPAAESENAAAAI